MRQTIIRAKTGHHVLIHHRDLDTLTVEVLSRIRVVRQDVTQQTEHPIVAIHHNEIAVIRHIAAHLQIINEQLLELHKDLTLHEHKQLLQIPQTQTQAEHHVALEQVVIKVPAEHEAQVHAAQEGTYAKHSVRAHQKHQHAITQIQTST